MRVYFGPNLLTTEPAQKPTIAKHAYRAAFAPSVRATSELILPPAPRPDKELNIPGEQKATKPNMMI